MSVDELRNDPDPEPEDDDDDEFDDVVETVLGI